jgi:hypothetical protein
MTSTDKAQVEGQSCGQTEALRVLVMASSLEQVSHYWKYRFANCHCVFHTSPPQ